VFLLYRPDGQAHMPVTYTHRTGSNNSRSSRTGHGQLSVYPNYSHTCQHALLYGCDIGKTKCPNSPPYCHQEVHPSTMTQGPVLPRLYP
jgi:hypothetical protein